MPNEYYKLLKQLVRDSTELLELIAPADRAPGEEFARGELDNCSHTQLVDITMNAFALAKLTKAHVESTLDGVDGWRKR